VNACKPLVLDLNDLNESLRTVKSSADSSFPDLVAAAIQQALTLVHSSAQLERFVWDRGCAWGLCSPCSGGVRGCWGV